MCSVTLDGDNMCSVTLDRKKVLLLVEDFNQCFQKQRNGECAQDLEGLRTQFES